MSTEQMEKKLRQLKSPGKRLPLLLDLASKFCRISGHKTLEFAREALQLSEHLNDQQKIIESLKFIADAHFFLSEYDTSIQRYQTAINLCETLKDDLTKSALQVNMTMPLRAKGNLQDVMNLLSEALAVQRQANQKKKMAHTLMEMASISYDQINYLHALTLCHECLDLLKDEPDSIREIIALECLGKIYSDIQENKKARECFFQALGFSRELGNQYLEGVLLTNIGKIFIDEGKDELALKYLLEAIPIQHQQHNHIHEAYSCIDLTEIYLHSNDLERASKMSEHSQELVALVDHKHIKMATAFTHAKVLNRKGQHSNAIPLLTEALAISEISGWKGIEAKILEQITISYEGLGDTVNALHYYKKLLLAITVEIDSQKAKELHILEAKIEIAKADAEREIYRLKAETLQKEIDVRTKEVMNIGLQLIQKNEYLQALRKQATLITQNAKGNSRDMHILIKQIDDKIRSDEARLRFETALQKLHGDFQIALSAKYPSLTKTEKKVCSLLKLNLRSTEIASLLFTSPRTIEWHRMNIRKKLRIPELIEVNTFFSNNFHSNADI